jgi:hypothetical protein
MSKPTDAELDAMADQAAPEILTIIQCSQRLQAVGQRLVAGIESSEDATVVGQNFNARVKARLPEEACAAFDQLSQLL